MQVTYIGISRSEEINLADRLDAEPYPPTCNVALVKGQLADGSAVEEYLRIELVAPGIPPIQPPVPGVHVKRNPDEGEIDEAIRDFIAFARKDSIP